MPTFSASQIVIEERPERVALVFKCGSQTEAHQLYEAMNKDLCEGALNVCLEIEPKS